MPPSNPFLALALRHFEKAVLAGFGTWCLASLFGLASAEAAAETGALAEQRVAILAHFESAHVAQPTRPKWSATLRKRLGPPTLEVSPFPTWLAHRRPKYLYQTEAGPEPIQPIHGALTAPTVRELGRGVVELTWTAPSMETVLLEGYVLERRMAEGAWHVIAKPGASTTRWLDEGLSLLGGLAHYRVTSRASLDAADPSLSQRRINSFPGERVSPPAEVMVSRRLYVLIHGVEAGDPVRERVGVAQGEIRLWNASRDAFDTQWFSAAEGAIAGRGAFVNLSVRIHRVWTQEEPAGGLTRTTQWAEVELPGGVRETLQAGRAQAESKR